MKELRFSIESVMHDNICCGDCGTYLNPQTTLLTLNHHNLQNEFTRNRIINQDNT